MIGLERLGAALAMGWAGRMDDVGYRLFTASTVFAWGSTAPVRLAALGSLRDFYQR